MNVTEISLITPARLQNLITAIQMTIGLPGDMAELGVYRGGSAFWIVTTVPNKILHLFDTFTGLPYTELPEHNPTEHDLNAGRFACDQHEVRRLLEGYNTEFHVGVFPATARGLESLRLSFVHIDCDLYTSAKDGIEWFWPRIVPGGIMFFDDYGCDFTGVTDAIHETFDESQIVKQTDHSNGFQIGAYVKKQ